MVLLLYNVGNGVASAELQLYIYFDILSVKSLCPPLDFIAAPKALSEFGVVRELLCTN